MTPFNIEHNYKGKRVNVYLSNGVKLTGEITEVYTDAVMLVRDNVGQSVFKTHIATIQPISEGN